MIGSSWRSYVGEAGRSITLTLHEPYPDERTPVDLSAADSVRVEVERASDRAAVQDDLATVVDAAAGQASLVLADEVTATASLCTVTAYVTIGAAVRVYFAGWLLVEGTPEMAGLSTPPLVGAGPVALQVVQWTPAGDQVIEVHSIGADLAPTGDVAYLWDDPSDATNALVSWPGDPNTLLDEKP